MTAITLTYDQLVALDPCGERLRFVKRKIGKWNGRRVSAGEARKAGCTLDDIIWVARNLALTDEDVERRLWLWLADCAAHVLYIYEKTGTSNAPRMAIIAARQYARDEIYLAASKDAALAAEEASWAARAGAGAGAGAARYAARAAAVAAGAAWAARAAAGAARAAAGAAGAVAVAAEADEEKWQFDRLVEWMSDDEPEDWPL